MASIPCHRKREHIMIADRHDWPHAPVHRLGERGAYMVTGGTYGKRHHLSSPERLDDFLALLFRLARQFGWELQAWAAMANHYHIVALSPEHPETLRELLARLHHESAVALNAADGTPNRRVWYEYWDTHLSYQRSYMARLKYVHTNPVHHSVVEDAQEYPWCSQNWFRTYARSSFQRVVESFETDRVRVFDDF